MNFIIEAGRNWAVPIIPLSLLFVALYATLLLTKIPAMLYLWFLKNESLSKAHKIHEENERRLRVYAPIWIAENVNAEFRDRSARETQHCQLVAGPRF